MLAVNYISMKKITTHYYLSLELLLYMFVYIILIFTKDKTIL